MKAEENQTLLNIDYNQQYRVDKYIKNELKN